MKESEDKITRKGMLAAAAGGMGALLLLASGKQARADGGISDVHLINPNTNTPISPATEDTLALIKTNTANIGTPLKASDLTFTKELGRVALIIAAGGGVIDPRDRNWTITETVPVSSTTLATATGQSTTQPRNISQIAGTALTGRDWSSDFSNLASIKTDVDLLSTGATVTPKAASVWDVSDRSARLAGRVSVAASDGGVAIDPRDVSDRAARLLGIAYGNLGQLDQRLVGTRNLLTDDLESVGGTALTGRDWSTDFSKLDVALSTRLKIADYVITQELGRVGIITAGGGRHN